MVALPLIPFTHGRFLKDGPFNGELFRKRFLEGAMKDKSPVVVELDGTRGYGSSFLEEAFGGLVRIGFPKEQIRQLIQLRSNRASLVQEILDYIDQAEPNAAN